MLSTHAQSTNLTQWPLHTTGLSNVIEWDHYSILINRRRTFLWSGEIHYCEESGRCIWLSITDVSWRAHTCPAGLEGLVGENKSRWLYVSFSHLHVLPINCASGSVNGISVYAYVYSLSQRALPPLPFSFLPATGHSMPRTYVYSRPRCALPLFTLFFPPECHSRHDERCP